MILTVADLRMRDVVRVCDAESLGCVRDVTIDSCTGQVRALIVLACGGFFSCGRELSVPFEKIRCIGEDVILADLTPEECCFCSSDRKSCKSCRKHEK